MNWTHFAALAAAACVSSACTDSSSASGPYLPPLPAGPPVVAPAGVPKPGYSRALQLSDQVAVGMAQQTVESMFGPPDKAGYQVYGRATPTPWRALVWEYVFDDVNPPRALSIVFEQGPAGQWVVNHGDWPAP